MVPARINLVTLGVADIAAATAFYERLGWRRSDKASTTEISFLALENLVLALFGRDALAAETGHGRIGRYGPGRRRRVALAVNLPDEAAVDAAIAAAIEAGARLLKAAEKTGWGGYSGYVADPDGHAWGIRPQPLLPARCARPAVPARLICLTPAPAARPAACDAAANPWQKGRTGDAGPWPSIPGPVLRLLGAGFDVRRTA